MPDITITIGGRSFTVACQEGEESFLQAAAELLDREARTLDASGTRLTQDRMLLMAGLLLADKSIGVEEELRTLDRRLVQQTRALEDLQRRPPPEPERVEVEVVREIDRPFVPDDAVERIDAAISRAETIAEEARALAEARG